MGGLSITPMALIDAPELQHGASALEKAVAVQDGVLVPFAGCAVDEPVRGVQQMPVRPDRVPVEWKGACARAEGSGWDAQLQASDGRTFTGGSRRTMLPLRCADESWGDEEVVRLLDRSRRASWTVRQKEGLWN